VLTGTVLAVTPAESDKSPAHITLVFQQAAGKGSAPQPLLAAIAKVDQVMTAMPSEPPRMMPNEPPGEQSDDSKPTLGEMPVPGIVTEGVPSPGLASNRPTRIEVTHMDRRGSELFSTGGDLKLPSGTRIELKVLSPPDGNSPPLLF
jgi:hypothetical protein